MTTRLTNDADTSNVTGAVFERIAATDILSARLLDTNGRTMTRLDLRVPELLAMLRSELGVLTIDKADLPEVEPERAGYAGYVGLDGESAPVPLLASAYLHRQEALRHLALAEYIEANPPVDEQQVTALVGLISEADGRGSADGWVWTEFARSLLRTGKVEVAA